MSSSSSSSLLLPSLLLETIKIENGEIHNLSYHQQRCDSTRETLFNSTDILNLIDVITPPQKGLYRCRILYAKTLHSVEYIPYTSKDIHSIKIVKSDIKYNFKYANRDAFIGLLTKHNDVDEILIEKDGYLSDITIANIAFYREGTWYTPATPLLQGTMRQKLLDDGFLQLKDIKKDDLHQYTQVALINAMIGFKILNHFNIR